MTTRAETLTDQGALGGTATGMPMLHRVIFIALLAVLLVAPFQFYPVFLMKVLCFALFASAFNLLLGFGGLLSFGHAMFFGMAGYVSAHLAKVGTIALPYVAIDPSPHWDWLVMHLPPQPPEVAILGGTIAAGLLGVAVGSLAIRRHGIYFAMVTLAFAQMVYFFALQAEFTGGEDGIQAVPRGFLFGVVDLWQDINLYYVVLTIFFIGMLVIYRIIHSPFGQVLKAIRDNEARATSLGYNVSRYKLMVFTMSATLAGLAGATKALVFQLASLTDVYWTMSGEVVLMTLLGGMGTVFGPMVGALVVVTMQNYLAHMGDWVTVIQGAIFVIAVMMFRKGIVGVLGQWLKRPL